ncbi:hypothetical protein L7F22_022635 [Adiantum nelumboides]|nr:hypothetical protein [Adiantum nelumboides]
MKDMEAWRSLKKGNMLNFSKSNLQVSMTSSRRRAHFIQSLEAAASMMELRESPSLDQGKANQQTKGFSLQICVKMLQDLREGVGDESSQHLFSVNKEYLEMMQNLRESVEDPSSDHLSHLT